MADLGVVDSDLPHGRSGSDRLMSFHAVVSNTTASLVGFQRVL
jgi:hypothetical protein